LDKVRIGFVGVGNMGQCGHLRNYVTLPDCEVVAIAELRENLGRRVAERYGVPRTYRSHDEMLAAEKLDGIVASQQYTRHGVIVPELLKAGVPILMEKPLAGTIEAGERILRALEKSGTWIMLGYHKRSDPAVMYAKAEIDRLKASGELGNLRYVRITMPPGEWIQGGFTELIASDEPVPDLESDPPPSDMDEAAYRQFDWLVNYYVHQLNLLRHLLGEPYRVSYADPSGILLIGHTESGMPGTIEMAPYTTTVDWQESALVAFEHGYIKLEIPAPMVLNRPGRVEILRDPGNGVTPETIVPTLPWVHAMRQQAINFVKAIRGEAKPLCEPPEALEDLKVAREYFRLLTGK